MPAIRNELPAHEVDGELVLYDPEADAVHTLNPTARFIWELCDGESGVDDIALELTNHYNVSIGAARRDVEQTLQQLLDTGLIRCKESA